MRDDGALVACQAASAPHRVNFEVEISAEDGIGSRTLGRPLHLGRGSRRGSTSDHVAAIRAS